jgi:hypothetical protein
MQFTLCHQEKESLHCSSHTWQRLSVYLVGSMSEPSKRSRGGAMQRDHVLISSIRLWDGPLGARITQRPYLVCTQ